MANRYWVGGTANWDATAGSKWESAPGAADSAAVPTNADIVYFNASSGASTVTLSQVGGCSCSKLICTGFTGTFAGSVTLYVYGDTVTFASTMSGTTTGHIGDLSFQGNGVVNLTSGGKEIRESPHNVQSDTYLNLLDNTTFNNSHCDFGTNGLGLDANGFNVVFDSAYVYYKRYGSTTVPNFTYAPSTGTSSNYVYLYSDLTVTGTFTANGTSSATLGRIRISSDTIGTQRTITAATVAASYVDFRETIGAGAGSWNLSAITGGSGDMQGNSSITFTTPVHQHWTNVNGGNWSDSANWTSRVPLPQDDVIFDTNFGTSKTVTVDKVNATCKSMDWSGCSFTTALTFTQGATFWVLGDYKLKAGMTMGTHAYQALICARDNASAKFTTAGVTINNRIDFQAYNSTYTLQDNLTVTNTITCRQGTLESNDKDISCTYFTDDSNIGAATLNMGTGTWTITGTSGFIARSSCIAVNCETSTIKLTYNSTSATTFSGDGNTFNKVWFDKGAGTGTVTMLGNCTIAELKDTGTEAHIIRFQYTDTFTLGNLITSGSAGKLITIDSSWAAHPVTLVKTGGHLTGVDYISAKDITGSPADTWYIGANSTLVSGNTEVYASNAPTETTKTFTLEGNVTIRNTKTFTLGGSVIPITTTKTFTLGGYVIGAFTTTYNTASSNNWVCPALVDQVTVRLWGSGGGGAGRTTQGTGGGGAGGTYAESTVAVTPGNTYVVVVAAATSTASGNGSKGNSSTFNSTTVVAEGGAGGTTSAKGSGSTALSTGTIKYAGGDGGDPATTVSSGGGGGGAGTTGTGGNAGSPNNYTAGAGTSLSGGNGGTGRTTAGVGAAGSAAGGGGSGAWRASSTNRVGGAGAIGRAEIYYNNYFQFKTNTIGGYVQTTETKEFTLGGNVASTETKTFTLEGRVVSVYTKAITLEGIVEKRYEDKSNPQVTSILIERSTSSRLRESSSSNINRENITTNNIRSSISSSSGKEISATRVTK